MESTYGNRDHESVAQRARSSSRAWFARRRRAADAFSFRRSRLVARRSSSTISTCSRATRRSPPFPSSSTARSPPRRPRIRAEPRSLRPHGGPVARHRASSFDFDLLTLTNSTDESKALNARVGPMVIIAGSGMAEGGRIFHHLRARRVEFAEHDSHRRLSGRKHARPAHCRAAAR